MLKQQKFNAFLLFFILFFLFLFGLSACGASLPDKVEAKTENEFLLNTLVSITYYDDTDADAVKEALSLCKDYELIFSRTAPDSELSRLNESGGMPVSEELLTVLSVALDYCEKTDGAFDISMGAVSSLYDFSGSAPHVPAPDDLQSALSHVDYRNIRLEGNTVTLLDSAAVIDLGAVAKGYIADRMKQLLLDRGVQHAIISLGGNVLCLGGRPDGTDFTVGIRYPEQGSSKTVAKLCTSELSVVTSGVYERYFEENGKTYHHILDPRTGQPLDNGLLAVSVVGPESVHCDALSTACFALGLEAGLAFINSIPDYDAIFITEDTQLHYSDNINSLLS